jgi:hypothetical protein
MLPVTGQLGRGAAAGQLLDPGEQSRHRHPRQRCLDPAQPPVRCRELGVVGAGGVQTDPQVGGRVDDHPELSLHVGDAVDRRGRLRGLVVEEGAEGVLDAP